MNDMCDIWENKHQTQNQKEKEWYLRIYIIPGMENHNFRIS